MKNFIISAKSNILICLLLFILSSCYYKPFVGYTLNKKGFKHFSAREKMAGENSNAQRDYKINRYDWDVEVFPDDKRISAIMDIHFSPTSSQKVFLFDLQKRMKIDSFTCDYGHPQIKRKHDFLYLIFEEEVPINTRMKFSVIYEGKPANVAGEGPVQWKKDELDRHWISSITEGIGPQFIMPCCALLRSEADSVTIDVTVPSDLVAVSNGVLEDILEDKVRKTKTYRHSIYNPINTYSLSFNIGHFQKIEKPHTDINGINRNIECQVLDYNFSKADSFYNQAPVVMTVFEKLYGEYPFWRDGCKFVESTFSAMEHQSAIAMGDEYWLNWKDYHLTLVHELSHEWWGNSITGKDYCDIWIHEGMATLSEALFMEQVDSMDAYNVRMKYAARSNSNTIPILKPCDVLYNSWANPRDQDIYGKGAIMMNSLRILVDNDSLFFSVLHGIAVDKRYQHISSDEIIDEFNERLGANYTSMFHYYLMNSKVPVLQIKIDKENHSIQYRWNENIPFYPQGKVWLKKGDELISFIPSTEFQKYELNEEASLEFLIEKSVYYKVEIQK